MTLQRFNENDPIEAKYIAVALPTLETLADDRDTFFNAADEAAPFGDVLYVLDRSPMVGVLTQPIFRSSFYAIHQLFTRPGTFEFYLTVFRAIWGPDVEIEFSVPGPGQLGINVSAIDIEPFRLLARRIESDVYIYEAVLTEAGENLQVQSKVGTKNQSEVDALMRELAPAGIYVVANLVLE